MNLSVYLIYRSIYLYFLKLRVFLYLFIYLFLIIICHFVHSFVRSLIRSLVRWCVHSFVLSFVFSFFLSFRGAMGSHIRLHPEATDLRHQTPQREQDLQSGKESETPEPSQPCKTVGWFKSANTCEHILPKSDTEIHRGHKHVHCGQAKSEASRASQKTAAKALQASSITANSSSIVDTPGSPGEFSSNFGIEACTCGVCQGQHSTDLTIKCLRPRSALLGT